LVISIAVESIEAIERPWMVGEETLIDIEDSQVALLAIAEC
jgi:hypothetical protein